MKKIILSLSLALCWTLLPVKAEIITLPDMDSVQAAVELLLEGFSQEEVLLGLDIDYTLVAPSDVYSCALRMPEYRDFWNAFKQSLDADTSNILMNSITHDSTWKLMEPNTATIVQDLQQKGVKTFAFTASLVGTLFAEKRFEVFRYERLKALGMSFDRNWPGHEEITFEEMPSHLGFSPVFYKGILCGNGEGSKGQTVVAFLKRTRIIPKLFIMVDDRRNNLEEIEKALQVYNPAIDFIGFEYTPYFNFNDEEISQKVLNNFWQKHLAIARQILQSLTLQA